jgi:hypothetical protein
MLAALFLPILKLESSTPRTMIFQGILCRWGTIQATVTNNGKPFIAALNSLAKQYGINHICISGYNTQTNSPIHQAQTLGPSASTLQNCQQCQVKMAPRLPSHSVGQINYTEMHHGLLSGCYFFKSNNELNIQHFGECTSAKPDFHLPWRLWTPCSPAQTRQSVQI